jgi:DME family drug/metabolite transporter
LAAARTPWIGPFQIALAAVLWSTSGFFVKAPWFEAWPEDSRGALLAFWRSFFALVLLLPLLRRPAWRWPMLPMVVCFALMIWSFLSAMVYRPAANAIWLQYLAPVWVLIVGSLFLGEHPDRKDWTMFGFCFAGVGLIFAMELRYGSTYATCLGILSGLAYAGVILCLRRIRDVDSVWLITLNHAGSILLLLPWVLQNTHHLPATSYVALAFFGVVQMSVPYILFARGLRSTTAAEASMLTLIEPLLLPVWVFVAWHNHESYSSPPPWTLIGGGLILTGLASRYLPSLVRSWRSRESGAP